MWEDPIVAEIHRIREKLAAEENFDIAVFFAGVRKRQAAHGNRLVPPPKRAEASAAPNAGRQPGPAGSASPETAPAA